jgi:hypothetical protein
MASISTPPSIFKAEPYPAMKNIVPSFIDFSYKVSFV